MNGHVARPAAAKSCSTALAFVCIAMWLAAAAIARPLGIWLGIGGAAIALGIAVLIFDRSGTPKALLLPSPRLALIGATACALMAAATYALYPVLARMVPSVATDTLQLYAAFRSPSPGVASIAFVPVVVGEELVWRGVVQASLVCHVGAWRGVALTVVVYALVHAPFGSPLLAPVAFSCGLVWGVLRATTASLVPTLVAHALWDAVILLFLPLDTR